MVSGDPNNIVTFSTSISDNLNKPLNLSKTASLIVDSPTSLVGGNVDVDLGKALGGWDWINSFTVVVKASTFGTVGFGAVAVPDQHNSPNKLLGPNGISTTAIDSIVTNTATATAGGLTVWAKERVWIIVPPPVPPPWHTQDIGTTGAAGSGTYAGGTFTVAGSGADIGGTADAFRFVYPLADGISPDASVVARVATQQNTSKGAKAGVMIRDSLLAGAMKASVSMTPGNGIVFSTGTATGGATTTVVKTGLKAPYWVKLVRVGTTFTASYSSNGSIWTVLGTKDIPMVAAPYIGLGVTSNKAGTLCTATFDNVTATP